MSRQQQNDSHFLWYWLVVPDLQDCMMILEASVEIPWLSRDLQTSGTSAAPFLDTEGESFLGYLEEKQFLSVG